MMNFIALNSSVSFVAGAFFFLFGLAIGSFLNVIAVRYDGTGRLLSLRRLNGRSHCPHCRRQLRWYELIPVISFIVQRGRCRGCDKDISWQYPMVELLTGCAFLLPYLYFYPLYSFPYHMFRGALAQLWLLTALSMILLSAIDARLMLIPHELLVVLLAVGLAFAFLTPGSFLGSYAAVFPVFGYSFLNYIAGGGIGFAVLALIVVISRGTAMGMGDVYLGAAMGLMMGYPDILFVFALSFLLGGAWSALLLLFRRARLTTLVPFGPFLVAGFWLHIFFSEAIMRWYFSLL